MRGGRMPGRRRCPDFARILRETSPNEDLRQQIATCFTAELHRLALLRCRNPAQAEDAAQSGLLTALESLDSFRGDAPIEAWLRRIVSSACSRLQRGRKNDPAFNLPFEETEQEADLDTATAHQEMAVLLNERLNLLREALEEVPEPNRTMFFLHEAQEVPLDELAKTFDVSVEAVKARLKRTRKTLRDGLLRRAEELLEA